MQNITGKTITLTRGDTMKIKVRMYYNENGTKVEYIPQTNDTVRFAMKKRYSDATPIIHKIIPNDSQMLQLNPADTAELAYGDYVYDIEITYESGAVDTFIDRATFRLTEEVE